MRHIIAALPANLDAVLCVCVHIAPDRPSMLPQILGKCGALPARHPAEKTAKAIDGELSTIRDVIVGGRATTRNVFEDPDAAAPRREER